LIKMHRLTRYSYLLRSAQNIQYPHNNFNNAIRFYTEQTDTSVLYPRVIRDKFTPSSPCVVSVGERSDSCKAKAELLAKKFKLPLVNIFEQKKIEQPPEEPTDNKREKLFVLNVYTKRLCSLERLDHRVRVDGSLSAVADFYNVHMRFCRANRLSPKIPLFRAVKIPDKEPSQVHIVNATAGFGKDAYLLAYHGYNVTLVERDPILYFLLAEAHDQAMQQIGLKDVVKRMRLIHGDITKLTPEEIGPIDVFYADMLYDKVYHKKWEKIKEPYDKVQLVLRAYTGTIRDEDVEEVLDAGKKLNPKKLVFKWPLSLQNLNPSIQQQFKKSRKDTRMRYDIIE
jgi:16S rRNA (guanine1516-N2)-methyltransferase